jgi:hypothetical protein
MNIKKYADFEKIEEGLLHNIVLGFLVSFGVLTASNAKNLNDKDKMEKIDDIDNNIIIFLNFMKSNQIKLNHKYDLNTIMVKYNKINDINKIDFENVLSKLNSKNSPISASVFTFYAPAESTKLIKIPIANLDLKINNKFKISFWDSGWFSGSNMIGGGVIYKFGT